MIPLPDKKYSIIYADPPWSYQNRGTRAAASKHYDTMTIEELKKMGVGAAGGGIANSDCLLAVKGKPKRVSASVHSVLLSPVRQHSQKPAEIRDRIVELMGDLPRIELFAREAAPGWDAWGNEAPAASAREEETDGQNNQRDPAPEL